MLNLTYESVSCFKRFSLDLIKIDTGGNTHDRNAGETKNTRSKPLISKNRSEQNGKHLYLYACNTMGVTCVRTVVLNIWLCKQLDYLALGFNNYDLPLKESDWGNQQASAFTQKQNGFFV